MTGKLNQQPVGLIKLEAPIRGGMQFFEVGTFKVVSRQSLLQLGKLSSHPVGVKVVVDQ
jgi:hypothetical protein